MTDARSVETCTSTNTVDERDVTKKTKPDTRRRGIAYAHLTYTEDSATFCYAVIHKV